jgi:hypothetical protein
MALLDNPAQVLDFSQFAIIRPLKGVHGKFLAVFDKLLAPFFQGFGGGQVGALS